MVIDKADLLKTKNFIETYYNKALNDNEIIALSRELKNYTYDDFKNDIQKPLLISVEYFTIAGLHRIIENNNRAKEFLKKSGKKSWDEFYANS